MTVEVKIAWWGRRCIDAIEALNKRGFPFNTDPLLEWVVIRATRVRYTDTDESTEARLLERAS